MAQHLKLEHRDHDNPVPLVCSATLVKKTSSGSGYVECPVPVKRTGNLHRLPSSRVMTGAAGAAGTSKGSKRQT